MDLVLYDSMCRAIDAAYEVDEVMDIRNKALAMERYFRMAKNPEPERRACEIRLRAERKAGKILAVTEKAKGNRNDGQFGGRAALPPKDTKTLAELGVTKDQSSKWQALAAVPEDAFEAALHGADKPTTTGILLASGNQANKPIDKQAIWLWGRLRDFERDGLLARNPNSVLGEMLPEMAEDVLRLAPLVCQWLGRIESERRTQAA
jgi:hypothetical protein